MKHPTYLKMVATDEKTRETIRALAKAEGRQMWKIIERSVAQYANRSRDYQNAMNPPISARDTP